MGVRLVTTVPLPANPVQTQNVLANESKGLTQSQPKAEEKTPDAIPIPDKLTKIKPKPQTSTKETKQQPVEEAEKVVPFGEGGPVSGPYGTFSAGGAKGGFGFTGGGGDFGIIKLNNKKPRNKDCPSFVALLPSCLNYENHHRRRHLSCPAGPGNGIEGSLDQPCRAHAQGGGLPQL